jgi:eukaryotic-like serine/threonine-protein kinase
MNVSNTGPKSTKEVFTAALGLPPGAPREEYLDQACGSDNDLRGRVSRLLQAEACGAANPLDAIVAEFAPDETRTAVESTEAPGRLPPPRDIGPYKLLEQIGEGGFGTVYMAEQLHPIRRLVAVKIIKPGMDSREVIARFEAERQALALMNHNHIARVFDGGMTDEGRPYFVMELVRGASITKYCDAARLTCRQRLELFLGVCHAVQHAHLKGIIHRDLKPSNVLVTMHDDKPVVKVIDFGIAKALNQRLTERTLFTRFHQWLGTPQYVSPEQAQLSGIDIDTRSDVYSLGVLLYELLTGTTPFTPESFANATFDEVRRIIREDDPPRPSARVTTLDAQLRSTIAERRGIDERRVGQQLRGELDWIVMKTLEKDRTRRYESASALAQDIERHLHDEPVQACPPSTAYRFRKFASRNKAVLATTTLIAMTLLLGIAGTSWQAWRAASAVVKATEERENALENFRRARNTVDTLLKTVEQDERLHSPEMQPLRGELLNIARRYFQEFVDDRRSHPELQADLAEAYLKLGDIAWDLGQIKDGAEADRNAVEIRKTLAAANPRDPEHQHNLAATYLAIADHYRDNQQDDLRKAIETAKTLPNQPAYRLTLAKAYLRLGDAIQVWYQSGNYQTGPEVREGTEAAQQAAQLFEQLLQRQPEIADYRFGLGEVYTVIAVYGAINGNMSAYDDYRQRAYAVLKKLVDDYPDIAEYHATLLRVYKPKVEADAEKAVETLLRLSTKHPSVVRYQTQLIHAFEALADCRIDAHERAVEAHERAIEIANALVKRFPRSLQHRESLAERHAVLGSRHLKAYRFEEAIASLQAAISHYTALKPHVRAGLSEAHVSLSQAYQAAGKVEEALAAQKNAIEVDDEIVKRFPHNKGWVLHRSESMHRYAFLLYQGGRLEEAVAECQRAKELQDNAFPDGGLSHATDEVVIRFHAVLAGCNSDMGAYLAELGRYAGAADAYRKALAAEAQMIRDVPDTQWFNSPNPKYDGLMRATRKSSNWSEAQQFLRQELSTWQELRKISKMKESCRIRELELQLRLAECLAELSRHDEASACYRDARQLLDELSASQPEWVAKAIAACIHVSPPRLESDLSRNGYQSDFFEAIDQRLSSALALARESTAADSSAKERNWPWNGWSTLAVAYFRPLQWEGADAEGRMSITLTPNEPEKLQLLAPLLLLAGNIEEYQSLCNRLLAEESKFWNHDHLKKILPLCLLDPRPAHSELLLRLASESDQRTPRDHLLSVAYYRAGNPGQGIEGLMSALKSTQYEGPLIELHLAIAHCLAGHQEEARDWLEKGRRQRDSVGFLNLNPANRLAYEVLRQQAEQLIAATQP